MWRAEREGRQWWFMCSLCALRPWKCISLFYPPPSPSSHRPPRLMDWLLVVSVPRHNIAVHQTSQLIIIHNRGQRLPVPDASSSCGVGGKKKTAVESSVVHVEYEWIQPNWPLFTKSMTVKSTLRALSGFRGDPWRRRKDPVRSNRKHRWRIESVRSTKINNK